METTDKYSFCKWNCSFRVLEALAPNPGSRKQNRRITDCVTLLNSILICELVHSCPDPDGVFYSVPIGWLLAVYSSKFVASALYPFQFIAYLVKVLFSLLLSSNVDLRSQHYVYT